jgi:hypothetical protein
VIGPKLVCATGAASVNEEDTNRDAARRRATTTKYINKATLGSGLLEVRPPPTGVCPLAYLSNQPRCRYTYVTSTINYIFLDIFLGSA